jgi:hypothetical protein
MEAVDVESKFEAKIRQAGLMPFFSASESHFLDLGGDLFVEIVARDGTKLPEFRRIAEEVKAENPGVNNVVVRAHWEVDGVGDPLPLKWEVERVGDPVPAYDMQTGTPRMAALYPVALKSGSDAQRIWVEVTTLASWVFEEHGFDSEATKRVIRDFVGNRLKVGGGSYWDPIRSSRLEIGGDAAEHIVSKRSAKQ